LRDLEIDDLPVWWVRWVDHTESGSSLENSHDRHDEIHTTVSVHHDDLSSLDAIAHEVVSENIRGFINGLVAEIPLR
jgi:hypothetical protein